MSIPSNPESINIACFISPHGFGHAARAAAVMESLYQLDRAVCFDIYTSVPQWFFEDSLSGSFTYHFLVTDVGLVQETPMQADLSSTVEQLDVMLPFDPATVDRLAEEVLGNQCRLILCDIAPLGIVVAQTAGIRVQPGSFHHNDKSGESQTPHTRPTDKASFRYPVRCCRGHTDPGRNSP